MRVDGPRPQPVQRPAAPRASRSRSSGSSRCRGRAAARALRPVAPRQRDHLPRHEPAVPGRDDLGHVPPRRGPGPRPADRLGAARRSTPGIARLGRAARLDAAGRLARRRCSAIFGSLAVLGRAAAVVRRRRRAAPRDRTTALAPPDGRDRRTRSTTVGPVITDFPIWLAETQPVPTLALPDETAVGRPRPGRDRRSGTRLAHRRRRRARRLAGRPRHGRRRAPTASRSSTSGAGRPGAAPTPLEDVRVFRDRLPVSGDPYTPKPMEAARAGTDARRQPLRRLHAEATAAVGYSANTLRERPRALSRGVPRGARRAGRRCATSSTRSSAAPSDGRAAEPDGAPVDRAADAAEAGRRRRPAAALRGDVDALDGGPRPPPGGAGQARARRSQPREHLAVPRARRRDARRPTVGAAGDRGRRSRCGSSRPRRPSGRASPRRSTTGRPRRFERDLPGRVHRARHRHRPAAGPDGAALPARAAPPRARRRPGVHQPAPAAGPRRARPRRRDRGRGRAHAAR